MTRIGALVLLLAVTVPVIRAQQPNTIRGRVLAAENQQPLRRALVSAARDGHDSNAVLTDDEGRFDLTIPGSVGSLIVSKGGYAPSSYEITRQDRTSNQEITVRLARGGVVYGRATRASGDAVRGARLFARRVDASPDDSSVAAVAVSDDLGEFRLSGLRAGRYQISPQGLPAVLRMVLANRSGGSLPIPPNLRDLRTPTPPTDPARAIDVQPGSDVGPIELQIDPSELPDLPPDLQVTRDARGGVVSVRRGVALDAEVERSLSAHERVQQRPNDLPSGAISGTIVDHAGEPFQGIHVEALRLERRGGRMVAAPSGPGPRPETDDRGRYRLSGLSPGLYLLVASTDAAASGLDLARGNRFTKVYYPGTPGLESAQTIRVDDRQEVSGSDLTYGPWRAVRVHGVARDRSGEPLVGQVRLIASQRSGAVAIDPIVNRVDWDGTFEFPDVVPGDYVVQAVGTNPGHRNEFGIEFVSVGDADPEPLAIVTSIGATLEGRFVVEGGQRPPLRFMSVHADPNDLDLAPAEGRGPDGLAMYDQGRFSLTGLRGAMRLTTGQLPAGWYLKSIMIGGIEVTDRPFDFGSAEQTVSDAQIVLSTSGATIAGTITGRDQSRPTGAIAVAFPRSRELWFEGSRYVKQSRGDADGSFVVDGLPAGEYWVVAVDRLPSGDWHSPEGLDALVPMATRVTLTEGQALSTELQLRRRDR